METPKGRKTQRYTAEEKSQLLANFDLEVEDRVRRFQSRLRDVLDNFLMQHETEITRIPRALRPMTMAEFGDKYNGDIHACLQGLTKVMMEKGFEVDILASARKRKQTTAGDELPEDESWRTLKNARKAQQTPKKSLAAPPSARRMPSGVPDRSNKTPTTVRFSRPSSQSRPSAVRQSMQRTLSQPVAGSSHRPPSIPEFNPQLPSKTPAYPRIARRNESLLSANGSPVIVPFADDHLESVEELPDIENLEISGSSTHQPSRTLRRTNSIVIRRDPALATSSLPPPNSGSRLFASSSHASIRPVLARSASVASMFSVSTNNGEILEFDPFTTDPAALDELDISDEAKRGAKANIERFLWELRSKWAT